MNLSPIVLFVYDRPAHTQRAIESLKRNSLSKDSELFIFSDAPKDNKAAKGVRAARDYLKTIEGFKKVIINERGKNLGLSGNIIAGVTDIVTRYGKVIVLEDDLVVSRHFLNFMNDALLFYENEPKVISVCGYMYPVETKNPGTFFLRIADCWGWATWRRGWNLFRADGKQLYEELKSNKLFKGFNLNGTFDYTKMLKAQIRGKNDSWAIRWYASAFLSDKLSLYPRKTLVTNTGFDCTGRHRGRVDYFKSDLSSEPVPVRRIPVIEDESIIKKIGVFWRKQRFNLVKKIPGLFREVEHIWLKT